MKNKLEEFSKRVTTLLAEPGLLEKRPAWVAVKAGATSLAPFAEPALAELLPEHSLVFILALTNAGAKRDLLLKALLQRVLLSLPSDGFIRLLTKFSQAELKDNLLPYIYETGSRGSVACYLAARLRVTLGPEAFQYFLKARTWHQCDLMNLSIMVKPEESAALCAHLETIIPSIESKTIQESFTEFRYILFNHLAAEPSLPEVFAPTVDIKDRASEIPAAKAKPALDNRPSVSTPASAGPRQTTPVPAVAEKASNANQNVPALTPVTPVSASSSTVNVHLAVPENLQKLVLPIGATLLAMTAGILYFTWYYSEPLPLPTAAPRNARAPQQWVDAITQRPVTAKYLTADKDYRMGELFLTRDKFAEALKLFEDALAIDPDHIQAMVRSGYCRMQIGDNKMAAEIFRKALTRQPSIDGVNLYLARICVAENKLDLAEMHLRAEYALNSNLTVGMELANFLARKGDQNEAMELISALQEKHPGKMLVLAPEGKPGENTDAEGQRQ